ncbi:hypothetical protein NL676_010677 [Syzygium grande]|nr:hypothetical protein NL676_010677 [Syzygium grande]
MTQSLKNGIYVIVENTPPNNRTKPKCLIITIFIALGHKLSNNLKRLFPRAIIHISEANPVNRGLLAMEGGPRELKWEFKTKVGEEREGILLVFGKAEKTERVLGFEEGFCWGFFLKALLLHNSAPNDGGCDGDDFAVSASSAASLGSRTCPSPRLHHPQPRALPQLLHPRGPLRLRCRHLPPQLPDLASPCSGNEDRALVKRREGGDPRLCKNFSGVLYLGTEHWFFHEVTQIHPREKTGLVFQVLLESFDKVTLTLGQSPSLF